MQARFLAQLFFIGLISTAIVAVEIVVGLIWFGTSAFHHLHWM